MRVSVLPRASCDRGVQLPICALQKIPSDLCKGVVEAVSGMMVPLEQVVWKGHVRARAVGAHKKKRTCRTPSAHSPPPAALLCLRPARQDADYGRVGGRVLSLSRTSRPAAACRPYATRGASPAGYASSHTPLRATARTAHWLPCGHIPLRATPAHAHWVQSAHSRERA